MAKPIEPKPSYETREHEALLAFATSVYVDPSSSPEDRATAKARLLASSQGPTDLRAMTDGELLMLVALEGKAGAAPPAGNREAIVVALKRMRLEYLDAEVDWQRLSPQQRRLMLVLFEMALGDHDSMNTGAYAELRDLVASLELEPASGTLPSLPVTSPEHRALAESEAPPTVEVPNFAMPSIEPPPEPVAADFIELDDKPSLARHPDHDAEIAKAKAMHAFEQWRRR